MSRFVCGQSTESCSQGIGVGMWLHSWSEMFRKI